MSTGTIEVTDLSDLNLDDVPPCQVNKKYKLSTFTIPYLCGEPSVARLSTHCNDCGTKGHMFICAPDIILLHSGGLVCMTCESSNFSWKDM